MATTTSSLPEMIIEKLASYDEHYSDKYIYHIRDTEVRVLDEVLYSSLEKLPIKKRNIILMFYYLKMSDTEIAKYLNISRIASFKSRKQTLEKLKEIIKER